ncbi:MAG: conotoxin [Burkholderiales bacterium]|nr:conotoxin [Burkholderiales bacterium]
MLKLVVAALLVTALVAVATARTPREEESSRAQARDPAAAPRR